MIVKKIKNQKDGKPKAWQIGDLVDYIRFPHNKNPEEKIEYAGGRNFFSSTHVGQKAEDDRSGKGIRPQQNAGAALDVFLAGRRAADKETGGGGGGHVPRKNGAGRAPDRLWPAL